MVESADATEVVGSTALQPASVSWATKSVARTISSSTTRIDRSLSGCSTPGPLWLKRGAHDAQPVLSCLPANLQQAQGTIEHRRRCVRSRNDGIHGIRCSRDQLRLVVGFRS